MKLWLSKNSEVPVRDQLVTQFSLAVVSGELAVGTRLPSTREISLRYGVHANTVSNAYQILVGKGLIEFRRGSGYFVRETPDGADPLGRLIESLFHEAAHAGFTRAQVRERLLIEADKKRPARVVVVEDDAALRAIVVAEIAAATQLPVAGVAFETLDGHLADETAMLVSLFDEKLRLAAVAPPARTLFLTTNSPAASMTGQTRPAPDEMIAVVSGWKRFLELARVFLVAAQIHPDALMVRSTSEPDWRKGIASASLVICDSLAASMIGEQRGVRVFRLLSEDSLDNIRELSQKIQKTS